MQKCLGAGARFTNSSLFIGVALSSIGMFAALLSLGGQRNNSTPFSLEERVAAQRAIEEVRWRHREWPSQNQGIKPSFSEVLPDSVLLEKVSDSLRMSNAVESIQHERITGERLQREIDRMAHSTRQPQVLGELFQALGNDPHRIAECLARPLLVSRLLAERFDGAGGQSFQTQWPSLRDRFPTRIQEPQYNYTLPAVEQTSCDDSWQPTAGIPERLLHSAVWTGSEMLVWGGELEKDPRLTNTGGRYDPATDTWRDISLTNAPPPRELHTAIWTGKEMIIFGGTGDTDDNGVYLYDPIADSWRIGNSIGAPAARSYHTAVWSGTEMIVWGGIERDCIAPNQCISNFSNNGGRYNPQTDQWQSITLLMAPLPREYHTAIWTGQQMIIWGGQSNLFLFGDGAGYDPTTDTWKAISSVNAPGGRIYHTAIWSGREMIIWGGYDGSELNDGGRYDPVADSWIATDTSSAPEGRDTHTAVWTGSRMIIWGGFGTDYLDTGGQYDPASDTWQPTTEIGAPSPRYEQSAVWSGSEMIIFGGFEIHGLLATGGRYDPVQDHWIPTSTRGDPVGRRNHSAVWTGAEMIIWGGITGDSGQNSDNGGRYDPATDSWAPVTLVNAPEARSDHIAVWTGREMIVWGGSGNELLRSGGRYNPATDSWTGVTQVNAPAGRSLFTGVWSGTELIVWGGFICGNPPTCDTPIYTNTGGRYNPSTDTWAATSSLNAPGGRTTHVAVWSGSEMIVWGGYGCDTESSCQTSGSGVLQSGGRYSPGSDSWVPTTTSGAPDPRDFFAAVWSGREMIVWGGGNESPPYFNTGGRYNPATDSWSPTSTAGAPAGRNALTSVWTGQEMIVWGGYDDNLLGINSGGRYDPRTDTWRPTTVTGAPPGRDLHTAVWTGNEMIVWGGWLLFPTATGGRYCAAVSLPAVQLTGVVSRKSHGSAGSFDVDLTSGNGIECRSGGSTGDYTLVFTFANTLTSIAGANVSSGSGTVRESAIGTDPHQYLVELTGVSNAERLSVALQNVYDSAGNFSPAVTAKMGVLLADVNASGRVDAADVSAVRQQTLQPVTIMNFRDDINTTGRIDAADVSVARQQTLTSLP